IDFPDPYSPTARFSTAAQYRGDRALVFGDASHRGGHASRIIKSCSALGLNVTDFLVVLDSRPPNAPPPTQPVPSIELMRVPFSACEAAPKFRVDPYTLSLRDATVPRDPEVFRTIDKGAEFYNFANQQKAILTRHCVNPAGRHFVAAIDFRQLVRPDA